MRDELRHFLVLVCQGIGMPLTPEVLAVAAAAVRAETTIAPIPAALLVFTSQIDTHGPVGAAAVRRVGRHRVTPIRRRVSTGCRGLRARICVVALHRRGAGPTVSRVRARSQARGSGRGSKDEFEGLPACCLQRPFGLSFGQYTLQNTLSRRFYG